MSLTLPVPVFFVCLFPDVLSLPSCFAEFAELGPLPTYALNNYVPRFLFFSFFASFLFYFLLFPSISIDDIGATSGDFFFWIFLFF